MRTPRPPLTNEQSRRSSVSANNRLIGTLSALASASRVASDGEIAPFSIFDSMPDEIPAATPSSVTVRSSDLRSLRTSAPMPDSSERAAGSTGASEPVRKSLSASRLRARLAVFRLPAAMAPSCPCFLAGNKYYYQLTSSDKRWHGLPDEQ